jgi:choline dehydrogenase-like flavoprotein
MIIDANSAEIPSSIEGADVAIVGAGTVGLMLAKLLADRGKSVVVVEAGDRVATTADDGLGACSIGSPHTGVRHGRAKGLGGTSALWGGQLAEFVEADLRRPGCEWPLQYSELCTWYERTYDVLGLPKRASDSAYQQAFGITAAGHDTIEQFFTFWLPQPNFAALFQNQITRSEKLRIYLNATINDILCEGARAQSLVARTSSGRRLSFWARDFVLAAGTIANIQCLLTARLNPNVPWRENRLIGAYFQDHLGIKACEVEVIDGDKFRRFFENGFALGRKLQPKLRFTSRVRAQSDIGVCGIFAFRSSTSAQLAQLKLLARGMQSGLAYSTIKTLPMDVWRLGGSLAPLVLRYIKDRRIMALYDEGIDFLVQAEQYPIAESRVEMIEGPAQPNGLMRVGVNWRIDGREINSIRSFVSEALLFLEAQRLARMRPGTGLPADDAMVLHGLADTFHQCGGLRMSGSPETGVTDANGRVWGTENVFVAGASVMPSSSYANSTLTALALGVRLSEHLNARQEAVR